MDLRYAAPPTNDAVVGLYCFPPDVFDVIDALEPSSRGELEITDVNRHYAQQGRLDVVQVEGWWEDAGKHWQHLAEIGRLVDETGAQRMTRRGRPAGSRCAGSRTSAAGSASSGATARCPRPTVQTNVSFSRKGVIRGLHFHERGQDDLFACLQGTARVVVLDRETGATFTEDIGDENPVAIYVPGSHAHGFEALTDLLFCYHVTEEYDPTTPTSTASRGTTLGSRTCGARRHRSCPRATPHPDHGRGRPTRPRARRGCSPATTCSRSTTRRGTSATRRRRSRGAPDLVLHAAAWTNVDGAEDDPQGAAAPTSAGRRTSRRSARRSSPSRATTSSTGRRARRTSSPTRRRRSRPTARTKLHGEAAAGDRAWIVRSSWLFGETGHNFVRTMLRLGAERDEVAVVDDQRGCPTYVGHLADATRALVDGGAAFGVWHLAAAGDCTWADFAEAIFEEAGLDCRVRRITHGRVRREGAAAGDARSSAARRAPRSCRTGATGCAPASRGLGYD